MSQPTVELEHVECLKDTGKALLCKIAVPGLSEPKKVWIPQSVIDEDSEVFDDGEHSKGTLILHEWFAIKENLV